MTTDGKARTAIDGDAYTVRRAIHIAAPVAKVWRAITEPELVAKWFVTSVTLDGRDVGAEGVFTFGEHRRIPVRIEELDEPHIIAYRWSNDDAAFAKSGGVDPTTIDDDHSLLMRFTLEPVAGGTQLTVVESGFDTTSDPSFNMESHRGGWDQILDGLVAYLEGAS
jgi:uncharacterized protein YndB with AHSA1/START domain